MKKILTVIIMVSAIYCTDIAAQESRTQSTSRVFSQQQQEEQVEITTTDNRIKVVNAPTGSVIEVYSVVGIKVKEIVLKEPDGEYPLNLAKGYYIIRIGEIVRKISIR